jgi:hypothetical protein
MRLPPLRPVRRRFDSDSVPIVASGFGISTPFAPIPDPADGQRPMNRSTLDMRRFCLVAGALEKMYS